MKCDNCNKSTKNNTFIIHQLIFSNIPETFYLCEYCCCIITGLNSNSELLGFKNEHLYKCLEWIKNNSYILPTKYNPFSKNLIQIQV